MSVLRFPRIYFRGEMSWDPCLANNLGDLYDAAKVELVLPPGVSIDQYKEFILGHVDSLGIWNYYGTHAARFENVVVTGGALAPQGPPPKEGDALLGKHVTLRGKLVDVDPAAVHTSQIFFDEMSVGDEAVGFAGLRVERMHSRWINFNRSLKQLPIAGIASVVWQTALDKDALQFFGQEGSELLGAFEHALERDDVAGVMIRFQTYRTLYFQNGQRNSIPQQPRTSVELKQLYATGQNFSNPAYSALVGVAGLWMRDDPALSAQGGRYLVPAGNVAVASRGGKDRPVPPGPAVFELDEGTKTLSLDFGSAFPETDESLEKADLGELQVVANYGGGPTQVAALPFASYSKASYDERAGIIDIDLSSHADPSIVEKIQKGQLALNFIRKDKTVPALAESEFSVIADRRGVYLNEGETENVRLSVLQYGAPAPAGTRLQVNAYDNDLSFVATVSTLKLEAPGAVEVPFTAQTAGIVTYQFIPFAPDQTEPTPPANLNQMTDFFLAVRTLPFDDSLAKDTPDAQLTWGFIYERILRVYDSFNPVMARDSDPDISKPLDNQSRMETLAESIKRVISAATFEGAAHMPVTRDMSAGRRLLLTRWCELVLEGKAPDMHLAAAAFFDRGLSVALNIAAASKDPRVGSV